MSKILERDQIYSMPIDIITAINNEWRAGIKAHDEKWHFVKGKYPDYSLDKYIVKNFPELKEQIEWELMTGNERMAKKFGHINKSKTMSYSGSYDGSQYNRDLDPFYDND